MTYLFGFILSIKVMNFISVYARQRLYYKVLLLPTDSTILGVNIAALCLYIISTIQAFHFLTARRS